MLVATVGACGHCRCSWPLLNHRPPLHHPLVVDAGVCSHTLVVGALNLLRTGERFGYCHFLVLRALLGRGLRFLHWDVACKARKWMQVTHEAIRASQGPTLARLQLLLAAVAARLDAVQVVLPMLHGFRHMFSCQVRGDTGVHPRHAGGHRGCMSLLPCGVAPGCRAHGQQGACNSKALAWDNLPWCALAAPCHGATQVLLSCAWTPGAGARTGEDAEHFFATASSSSDVVHNMSQDTSTDLLTAAGLERNRVRLQQLAASLTGRYGAARGYLCSCRHVLAA